MAFVHGKASKVYLGAVDLSTYLNSVDYSADLDTADTTTFGATWKTAIPGTGGGSASVAGLYDPAEASLPTMILAGTPGVLTVCPGAGAAIGDTARMFDIYDVSYAKSVPVGGIVAISASFLANGTVAFGNVLHPLAEDTNTTTGASRDDSAATTTGWTAHLHVTAVDGGSWVVKIEDSADNAAWAEAAGGGSFTAATGATSQRLQSVSATSELRRYVRYVATRTGGIAGDGITFHLSYARIK